MLHALTTWGCLATIREPGFQEPPAATLPGIGPNSLRAAT